MADIVDEAKHLNRHIMSIWSSKKLELEDIKSNKCKFFVRVGGTVAEKLSEVEAAFGKVSSVELEDVKGEFAFITDVISEAEYEEAAKKVADVKQRIRVEA